MLSTILEIVNNQPGGLAGLLASFQQHGLGHLAASCVGNGQNLPVSADQLQDVLGGDMLGQLAGKLGIAPEAASSQLANILPGIVDKLTPNGELPPGRPHVSEHQSPPGLHEPLAGIANGESDTTPRQTPCPPLRAPAQSL